MSKLFKLKKWLSVSDAAEHLSLAFGEKVTESDVIRFALDGDLTLSVHLVNGAFAKPCVPINIEAIEWDEVQSPLDEKTIFRMPKGGRVWADETGTFQVLRNITQLDEDVFNLPMVGGERIDVEYHYQQLTGGPERTAVSLDGVMVASSDGQLFEIQTMYDPERPSTWKKPILNPDNFHPAGALPDDCVFVVRTDALTKFIQSLNDESQADVKPLRTTERNTLLTIIAALAKAAKCDVNTPGKTALFIEGLTAELGAQVSKRAIEDHLKKIPDALETRMK